MREQVDNKLSIYILLNVDRVDIKNKDSFFMIRDIQ